MVAYALAATVHDPEGRFLPRLGTALGEIAARYVRMAAASTVTTSQETLDVLRRAGVQVVFCAQPGAIGEARRIAIRAALRSTAAEWIHYADLDRLLHWQHAYPEELRQSLAQPPTSDYVAHGRSPRALATHPTVQIMAETLTNSAYSALSGQATIVDVVAGSFLLSRRAAQLIAELSVEPTNATDLEWPALIHRELGVHPEFRLVEGLEFETADYFGAEIDQAGALSAWMHDVYDQPDVWLRRTQLALDSIAAYSRVIGSRSPSP